MPGRLPLVARSKPMLKGKISACNQTASNRGVVIGMTVQEAALKLLAEVEA